MTDITTSITLDASLASKEAKNLIATFSALDKEYTRTATVMTNGGREVKSVTKELNNEIDRSIARIKAYEGSFNSAFSKINSAVNSTTKTLERMMKNGFSTEKAQSSMTLLSARIDQTSNTLIILNSKIESAKIAFNAMSAAMQSTEKGLRLANSIAELELIRSRLSEAKTEAERLRTQFDVVSKTMNLGNNAAEVEKSSFSIMSSLRNVNNAIRDIKDAFLSVAVALAPFYNSFTNMITARNQLLVFGGGVEGANEALARMINKAEEVALPINALTGSFAKFATAMKISGASAAQTEEIFDTIAKTGRVLNMSTQDLDLTFLALQQMVSKGTVSMEELRRQLGERIPGVFELAAKAMNMTTGEFAKQVEGGNVLALDLLPKLIKELQKTIATEDNFYVAMEKGSAAVARMQSEFTQLAANIGGAIDPMIKKLAQTFTATFEWINKTLFGTEDLTLTMIAQNSTREQFIQKMIETNKAFEENNKLVMTIDGKTYELSDAYAKLANKIKETEMSTIAFVGSISLLGLALVGPIVKFVQFTGILDSFKYAAELVKEAFGFIEKRAIASGFSIASAFNPVTISLTGVAAVSAYAIVKFEEMQQAADKAAMGGYERFKISNDQLKSYNESLKRTIESEKALASFDLSNGPIQVNSVKDFDSLEKAIKLVAERYAETNEEINRYKEVAKQTEIFIKNNENVNLSYVEALQKTLDKIGLLTNQSNIYAETLRNLSNVHSNWVSELNAQKINDDFGSVLIEVAKEMDKLSKKAGENTNIIDVLRRSLSDLKPEYQAFAKSIIEYHDAMKQGIETTKQAKEAEKLYSSMLEKGLSPLEKRNEAIKKLNESVKISSYAKEHETEILKQIEVQYHKDIEAQNRRNNKLSDSEKAEKEFKKELKNVLDAMDDEKKALELTNKELYIYNKLKKLQSLGVDDKTKKNLEYLLGNLYDLKESTEKFTKAEEESKRMIESTYTPLQRHAKAIEHLNDVFANSLMLPSQYDLQRAKIDKDLEDELKRIADSNKNKADQTEKIYEEMAKNIHNSLTKTFENLLSGQVNTFNDFFSEIKKMFIKWLAEMAALAVSKKITVPIMAVMGSVLGVSSEEQSKILGNMGLGDAYNAYKAGKTGYDFFTGGQSMSDGFLSGIQNASTWAGIGGSVGAAAGSALEAELFMSAPFEAITANGVVASGFAGTMATAASFFPVIAAISAIASLSGLFKDKPDNMWYRLGSGDLGPVGSASGNTTVNQKDMGDALFSANGPFGKIFISGWEDISGDIQNEFASTMVNAIKESDTAIATILGSTLTAAGKDALNGFLYQSQSWVETKDPKNYVDDVLVERYAALFSGIDSVLGEAFVGLQDTTTATAEQVLKNAASVAVFASAMDSTGLSAEQLYSKVNEMGVTLDDGAESVATSAAIYAELNRQSQITGEDFTKLTKYMDSLGGATVDNAKKLVALRNASEKVGVSVDEMLSISDAFYGSQVENIDALVSAANTGNEAYVTMIQSLIASGDAARYTSAEAVSMASRILEVNKSQVLLGRSEFDLSEAGYKGAEAVVTLYGGIDNLAKSADFYYNTLLSDEDKLGIALSSISSQFGDAIRNNVSSALKMSDEQFRIYAKSLWDNSALLAEALGMTIPEFEKLIQTVYNAREVSSKTNSSGNSSYSSGSNGSSGVSDYGNPAAQEEYIKEQANMLFDSSNSVTNAIVEAYIAAGKNIQEQLLAANNSMAVDMESNRNQILADYLASKGYFGNESGGISGGGQAYYNGLVDPITGDPMHHTPVYDVMTAEEWAAFSAKPIEELMNLTSYSTELYVRRLFNASNENKKKIDELNKYADEYGQENAQAMYDFMQKRNSSLQAIIDANITDSDFAIRGDAHQPNNYAYIIKELQKRYGDVFNEVLAQVVDPNAIGEVITGYVERGGWDEANQSNWSALDPIIASQEDLIGKTYQDLLDSGAIFQLPQSIIDQMRQAAIDGNTQYAEILKLWDEAQQNLIDGFSGSGSDVKTALDRINEALRLNNIKEISAETDEAAKQIARDLASIFAGVDNAISALNNYGGFVLTDAERSDLAKANAQSQVDAFNHTLGLTGDSAIDTAEELRQYVEGLDLSTESGREAFKNAMDLVDALKLLGDSAQQTANAIAEAIKIQEDNKYLWMDDADKLALQIEEMRSAFDDFGMVIPATREEYRRLLLSIDATTEEGRAMIAFLSQWIGVFGDMTDTVTDGTTSVQNAWDDYQKAYDAEVSMINEQISLIEDQISAQEGLVDSYKGIVDTIEQTINDMNLSADSPLSPQERLNNIRDLYTQALASIQNATTEEERIQAYNDLADYAQQYADTARDFYGANEEYAEIWNSIQNDLETARDTARQQLNINEAILASLNSSLSTYNAQLDVLKNQYTEMQKLYNAALGIDDSVLSVASAVNALASVIAAMNQQSQSVVKQPTIQEAIGPFVVDTGPTYTIPGWGDGIPRVPKMFADGGLASGWSIVGEQGPELVNFTSPGRVYTAEETSGMLGYSASNDEVVELLSEVLTELKAANQQRGQVATVQIKQLSQLKSEAEAQKRAIQRA